MSQHNAFAALVRDLSQVDLPAHRVQDLLRNSTYLAILVEFGTAAIPLAVIADKYFGVTVRRAKELASEGKLEIATFKCGSQKSQYMVHAQDLSNYIDESRGVKVAA
jgi:hypothetical protein